MLYKKLLDFSQKVRSNFFVPGHKTGQGLSKDFKDNVFCVDVTEFSETDDLQNPNGIIKKSQEFASKLYGSDYCFFLTCGSSAGIMAMILAVCHQGDKIIVDRNCHKSVINAIILSGAVPVFLNPEILFGFNILGAINTNSLKKVIKEYKDVKAILITYPNYYGICCDLEKIREISNRHNIPLLIDGAHSAHFKFNDNFPKNPVNFCDACVMSVHKTLPCLTQTSILHIKNDRINQNKVFENLKLITTTSPSYILMSSIDYGLRVVSKTTSYKTLILKCEELEQKINEKTSIFSLSQNNLTEEFSKDSLKLTFNFSKLGIRGEEASEILFSEFGIKAEMANGFNLLFVVTHANKVQELENLKKALFFIDSNCEKFKKKYSKNIELENTLELEMFNVELKMNPRTAYFENKKEVLLWESEGRICAQIVSTCPPGVPFLIPGQIITQEILKYIETSTRISTIFVID